MTLPAAPSPAPGRTGCWRSACRLRLPWGESRSPERRWPAAQLATVTRSQPAPVPSGRTGDAPSVTTCLSWARGYRCSQPSRPWIFKWEKHLEGTRARPGPGALPVPRDEGSGSCRAGPAPQRHLDPASRAPSAVPPRARPQHLRPRGWLLLGPEVSELHVPRSVLSELVGCLR